MTPKRKKKRSFIRKDIGKVLRYHNEPHGWIYLWSSSEYIKLQQGDYVLVHSVGCGWRGSIDNYATANPIVYLYKAHRKHKWIYGTLYRGEQLGYFEELNPLEVMIVLGTDLPRKYKRKQFHD